MSSILLNLVFWNKPKLFGKIFSIRLYWNNFARIIIFYNSRICRGVNEIFYISNLVNFFASTSVICTMGFLVMITGFTDDLIIYIFSLLTVSCQFFFMSWIGEKLTYTVKNFNFLFSMKFHWLFNNFNRVAVLVMVFIKVNGTMGQQNFKKSFR